MYVEAGMALLNGIEVENNVVFRLFRMMNADCVIEQASINAATGKPADYAEAGSSSPTVYDACRCPLSFGLSGFVSRGLDDPKYLQRATP